MEKKLIVLVVVLLTTSLVSADPNLVGWWKVDDPQGIMLWDYSGNDNHGAFVGDANVMNDPCGVRGEVLSLNETHVEVGHVALFDLPKAMTMAAWINVPEYTKGYQTVIAKGNATYRLGRNGGDKIGPYINKSTGGYVGITSQSAVEGQGWVHVAVTCDTTVESDNYHIFVNGVKERTSTMPVSMAMTTAPLWIGGNSDQDRDWKGFLDDIRLYNKALGQKEILEIAENNSAQNQSPDGQSGLPVSVELSWIAAFSESRTFNVYYGTDANSVRDSQPGSLLGDTVLVANNTSTSLTESFQSNTTYYWRVDVVDGAAVYADEGVHDFTTAQAHSYNFQPIDGMSDIPCDSVLLSWSPGSEAVDGYNVYMGANQSSLIKQNSALLTEPNYAPSGLAENTTYYWQVEDAAVTSVFSPVMSFTTSEAVDPNLVGWWKMESADRGELWDYSGNSHTGTLYGDATVISDPEKGNVLSLDGTGDYASLGDGDWANLAGPSGTKAFTIASWIKVDNFHDKYQCVFSKGTDIGSGCVFRIHRYNLGDNMQAMMRNSGGSTNSVTFGDGSVNDGGWHHIALTYKDGIMKTYLDGGSGNSGMLSALFVNTSELYIGRDPAETASRFWQGAVDDLRIYNRELAGTEIRELYEDVYPSDYILIDDMEEYDDITKPIDGPGGWRDNDYNPQPSGSAAIGKASNDDPAILEQSLAFTYDNYGNNNLYWNSECVKILDSSMDWTENNLAFLTINFYGLSFNYPEKFYVALEDAGETFKTLYYNDYFDDPNVLLTESWQVWEIPLNDFTGVDLTQVKKLYLGCGTRFDTDSASSNEWRYGTVYFDDITVDPPSCRPEKQKPAGDFTNDCVVDLMDVQLMAKDWLDHDYTITAEPVDDSNLVGWWKMEDTNGEFVLDYSGNDYQGTLVNNAQIIDDPQRGRVLSVGGSGDYVDFGDADWTNVAGPNGIDPFTIATWFKVDTFDGAYQCLISKGANNGGEAVFRIHRYSDTDQMQAMIRSTAGVTSSAAFGDDSVNDGGWHHLALTYEDEMFNTYLDGALENTESLAGLFVNTSSFYIGRDPAATVSRYWKGLLDDFRLYNKALSQGEIVYVAYNGDLTVEIDTPANLDASGIPGQEIVNYKDFSILADEWLEEILWP